MSIGTPPRVYAEWLPLLDQFREGDDAVLEAMRAGTIEWTNVVAERWTSHIAGALTARLQAVSRQLQVGLDRSRGDVFAISKAMIGARRSLVSLRLLATLPCAPENVQKHLVSELDRFVTQTQETLEKGAREIRHDNGLVLKAIRDNPLTSVVNSDSLPSSSSPVPSERPATRGPRHVL
jgi:hypothetical protein